MIQYDAVQTAAACCEKKINQSTNHYRQTYLAQNVEEEWVDVVVESLVVQEQLRQQAEVLAVNLVGLPVYLVHRHAAPLPALRGLSVDFVSWRVPEGLRELKKRKIRRKKKTHTHIVHKTHFSLQL